MPNAAARLDDDYGFGQPAPRTKPRRAAATKSKRDAVPQYSGQGRSRYIRYAAAGFTATLAIGIVINALALQNSRHPAPLFGKAIQLGDQPVTLATDSSPSTAAADAAPANAPALTVPAPAPAANPPASSAPKIPAALYESDPSHIHHAALDTAAAAHPKKPAKPEHPAGNDDPIAAMLKTSTPAGATEKPPEPASKTILAVQHALMKIGYVVALTGTYGPATRTAVEAFEREQHLPVTGELTHRLLKELSTESGIAIN